MRESSARSGHGRVRAVVLFAAVAALAGVGSAAATGGGATTTTMALDRTVWVPCAGTAGENVRVQGSLQANVAGDPSSSDRVVRLHYNPADVVGTGETTGIVYRGTGVSSSTTVTQPTGTSRIISIENFRLVSQTSAPNLTFHLNVLLEIADDGSIVAVVENVRSVCA